MNVTLIGYRGSGKSTVARLVAERLGWSWVDADALLEQQAGRTIREIFASEGESGFREREEAIIRELLGRDRCVVAAGGGAVLRPENCEIMRRSSWVVWLIASPDRKSTRLNSSHIQKSRMPSSA